MKRSKNVIFKLSRYSSIMKDDKPCKWKVVYQSLVGRGLVEFIDDATIKS